MINTLHLGLSYNCNMKCKHCFVSKLDNNIDLKRIYSTIDYLDNNGLFFVIYTFGEPLLAKEFWEVSGYIAKKNIVQILMTNGSILNDDIIRKLKKNNVKNIYVSIDSVYENKHDLNRNYKGAFKKAINTLKQLSNNGFNVGIATTINDDNVFEMEDVVNLAKELKINKISFLRQRINGKLVYMHHVDEYYNFYDNYLKNYNQFKISILFHDLNLVSRTVELYKANLICDALYEKYIDMNSCHYCDTLSIEPNGNVKKCNLTNGSIGNINENNIEDILKGEKENESIDNCT